MRARLLLLRLSLAGQNQIVWHGQRGTGDSNHGVAQHTLVRAKARLLWLVLLVGLITWAPFLIALVLYQSDPQQNQYVAESAYGFDELA